MTDATTRPPTPQEIEFAKLMQVRALIGTIRQNNHLALEELLYRLTNSFKGRLRTGPDDTAEPEECAQALLAAVLMAAIAYQAPEPQPAPGQYAVIDVETHQVVKSFATEREARDFLNSAEFEQGYDHLDTVQIVPVALRDPSGGEIVIDDQLKPFFPGK